jgi:hypothetical protein
LTTLEAIFQGKQELFKGLWIYDSDYQWTEHSIIRIDFSRSQVTTATELEQNISSHLNYAAQQHGVKLEPAKYYDQFVALIRQLGPVVILVDEYDKPIIDNIENVPEARRIREVLKGFYTVIKGMDEHLRFVLLTGVSKFSKVGVFSGLNNLEDITMSPAFSAALGITGDES